MHKSREISDYRERDYKDQRKQTGVIKMEDKKNKEKCNIKPL